MVSWKPYDFVTISDGVYWEEFEIKVISNKQLEVIITYEIAGVKVKKHLFKLFIV